MEACCIQGPAVAAGVTFSWFDKQVQVTMLVLVEMEAFGGRVELFVADGLLNGLVQISSTQGADTPLAGEFRLIPPSMGQEPDIEFFVNGRIRILNGAIDGAICLFCNELGLACDVEFDLLGLAHARIFLLVQFETCRIAYLTSVSLGRNQQTALHQINDEQRRRVGITAQDHQQKHINISNEDATSFGAGVCEIMNNILRKMEEKAYQYMGMIQESADKFKHRIKKAVLCTFKGCLWLLKKMAGVLQSAAQWLEKNLLNIRYVVSDGVFDGTSGKLFMQVAFGIDLFRQKLDWKMKLDLNEMSFLGAARKQVQKMLAKVCLQSIGSDPSKGGDSSLLTDPINDNPRAERMRSSVNNIAENSHEYGENELPSPGMRDLGDPMQDDKEYRGEQDDHNSQLPGRDPPQPKESKPAAGGEQNGMSDKNDGDHNKEQQQEQSQPLLPPHPPSEAKQEEEEGEDKKEEEHEMEKKEGKKQDQEDTERQEEKKETILQQQPPPSFGEQKSSALQQQQQQHQDEDKEDFPQHHIYDENFAPPPPPPPPPPLIEEQEPLQPPPQSHLDSYDEYHKDFQQQQRQRVQENEGQLYHQEAYEKLANEVQTHINKLNGQCIQLESENEAVRAGERGELAKLAMYQSVTDEQELARHQTNIVERTQLEIMGLVKKLTVAADATRQEVAAAIANSSVGLKADIQLQANQEIERLSTALIAQLIPDHVPHLPPPPPPPPLPAPNQFFSQSNALDMSGSELANLSAMDVSPNSNTIDNNEEKERDGDGDGSHDGDGSNTLEEEKEVDINHGRDDENGQGFFIPNEESEGKLDEIASSDDGGTGGGGSDGSYSDSNSGDSGKGGSDGGNNDSDGDLDYNAVDGIYGPSDVKED